jgi:hypothetical protein
LTAVVVLVVELEVLLLALWDPPPQPATNRTIDTARQGVTRLKT